MNSFRFSNLYLVTLCYLIGSMLFLLSPTLIIAAEMPAIKVNPITQTTATAASSSSSAVRNNLDDQSNEILIRLKAAITKQKNATSAALNNPQTKALQILRHRVGQKLEVKGIQETGIPRQLKGGVLETRIKQTGSEEEQDKKLAGQFFNHQKALLGLVNPANEMRFQRLDKDELGRRHLRYQQMHLGLPVWPAGAIVHLNAQGNVDAFDGGHVKTPKKSELAPVLDKAAALTNARKSVPNSEQSQAKAIDLILYAQKNQEPKLAWKIELPIATLENWLVIIDAVNGKTLTAFNQVPDANVSGAGGDLLGNNRPLNVWQDSGKFWLVDASKLMFDSTKNPVTAQRKGVIEILDARNMPATSNPENAPDPDLYYVTSTNANSNWVPDAISAAFNFSETYDYYLNRHKRNSFDNAGATITGIVRYGKGFQNAFWNGKIMVFGDSDRWAGSLDVVGHELSHAVTQYTANLVYQNQSGALNEAFSDILGESIEAYSRGSNDWLMGTDMNEKFRSMKNPALYNQPSKMSEFRVLANDRAHDNGGVHINSGIINHAFYLLVEGLNGGIGILDAERIFYRALTVHLLQNSEFVDARRAAILSAEEIFGVGSVQAQRTAQAFDAVEITDGSATPTPTPIPTVNGVDSIMSLYYDTTRLNWYLTRRETALSDPIYGSYFSNIPVSYKRPSLTGDGAFVLFVSADHDVCLADTNDSTSASCLGYTGKIKSISFAPSGDLAALVMRDNNGDSTNQVTILDLSSTNNSRSITLETPATDGFPVAVKYADALSFTPDNRYLIFDAFNEYKLPDGTQSGSWSIYALDLSSDHFLNVINVIEGFDIGYPSAGHTRSDLLVFEAKSQTTDQSTIFAANLGTGKLSQIGQVRGGFSVPGFNGNDREVLYSIPDDNMYSGASLYTQQLDGDNMTPVGGPALSYQDRDFGVYYRRGEYSGKTSFNLKIDATFGKVSISPSGGVCDNQVCNLQFPQNTSVTMIASPIADSNFSHWVGCDRVGGNSCSITMSGDKAVEAWFVKNEQWSLSVINSARSKKAGFITSDPSGINCKLYFAGAKRKPVQSGACNAKFLANSAVTLAIDPKTGLILDDNPSGCDVGSGQTCVVNVRFSQSQAKMGLVYSTKSLSVNREGNGKITGNGISCGQKCFKTYTKSTITKIKLQAKPSKGWRLSSWNGCDKVTNLSCAVNVYNARSVKAIFIPK